MFMRSLPIVRRPALSLALPCCLLSVCLIGLLSGCKEQQPEAAAIATASVAPVTRGDLSSTLTVAGEFQPYQEVDLHAKVSGYIRRINVDIGDRVKTGAVLAVLEVPELNAQVAASKAVIQHSQSEIARAQSEVSLAQADHAAVHAAYTRLEEAAKRRPGLIAEQELDDARAKDQNAEAKVSASKSAVEATQEQLAVSKADNQRVQSMQDYSIVTAPFNGVVTVRYADVGSLIQAGTASDTQSMPVVKLAQSDVLRLRMPVPEEYVRYIHTGGDIQITVKATGKKLLGKVVRFSRELNTSTRTMMVEVDVPNPDLTLTSGMYAEATLVLEQRNNVLLAPVGAVVRSQGEPYVLVVDHDNKVVKVPVTLGIEDANRVEITHGLSQGQSVIVSGQTNYQAGQTVRPRLFTISMPDQGENQ
ncbi:MAG: efflux RND transporter periplasmic adaptor subunit [Acidobacteriota bacterium]|nr:efflux RND transporter periplasmic adaptor subunit [Acidobacteriota bacterium]